MRNLAVGFLFVLAQLAAAVGATAPVEAGDVEDGGFDVVGRGVVESVQTDETARVMIVFEVPSAPGRAVMDGEDAAALEAEIEAVGNAILGELSPGEFVLHHRFRSVNALAGEVTAEGLQRVAADPRVLRVDLDLGGEGHLNQARPLANVDDAQALGLSGAGVTVAVLDSGYDTDHADLSDDLVEEQCFCSGGGGCCPGGGATQSGAGSAEDDHGHGTNVSGIITSAGTIAPLGGAPDAEIVAIKVLDSTNSFCCSSDIVAALNWIIDNQPGVDIVNMSLGTNALYNGNCDTADAVTMAFATAINTLRSNGVAVFVSSGNQGSGTQMSAPACVANSISVGAVWDSDVGSQTILGCTDATTAADQVTCFSNSNATTDLFAPGAPTTSTGMGGGTSTFFGTSQASPLAAACAALLLEDDPTRTPNEIETALESSPTLVTDATNGLSFPRLDCLAAVCSEDFTAPTIQCPLSVTLECDQSTDPSNTGVAVATDDCDASPTIGFSDGVTPGACPQDFTITRTWTATDASGNFASCDQTIEVEDTTAPDLSVELTPDVLWPPNHKFWTVSADITVTDDCDGSPAVTLVSITSNEPDNSNGDGNTSSDVRDADLGTDDRSFRLRAERRGPGVGRVYTVTYSAVDDCGNSTATSAEVRVPHDQSGLALAWSGIATDGTGLDPQVTQWSMLIPSSAEFDATGIDTAKAYVGNHVGVQTPVDVAVVDYQQDGLLDLILVYDAEQTRDLLSSTNSLLGLHYRAADGTDYAVSDVLALPAPVQEPLISEAPDDEQVRTRSDSFANPL